jgi:hypothetical protein
MKTRNQFPKLLNDSQCCVGVELGVFKGQFSKTILDTWNGTLYLVDVWRKLPDNQYSDMSNQKDPIDIYSETIKNISGYEDRAFMLRMSGNKAVNLFQDQSLDFIYIDANHTYEAVKQDIELWYPKIKSGGIFSGHDYLPKHLFKYRNSYNVSIYNNDNYIGLFGVNPAVDEFIDKYNLNLHLTDEFFGTWWTIK